MLQSTDLFSLFAPTISPPTYLLKYPLDFPMLLPLLSTPFDLFVTPALQVLLSMISFTFNLF